MPSRAASELAAPYRDPGTGRFGAGNPGGRLRQVAALGKLEAASLLRLPADSVTPFLRPHLVDAQRYVQALVEGLPAATDELIALCGDEARARLLAAACAAEGARQGCDPEAARAWRQESREWAREVRQTLLTRKAIVRDTPKPADSLDAHEAAAREFGAPTRTDKETTK
ncbi:MAG: hypothetical protein ABI548_04625 [Polyangiaceae bacterium]